MKKVTKNEQLMVDNIINILKKLKKEGVFPILIDIDGCGKQELAFWKPSVGEALCSYEIVNGFVQERYQDFIETSYIPKENDIFIDHISLI